jgi:peptidoglycan/xylan/chitin deacetylase (PgdA/CDA1 family)
MTHTLARFRRAVSGFSRRSARRRGVILLYHRVADPPSDPWALSVSPKRFAEHIDVLRRHARTARLLDLIRDDPRTAHDRAVAVTFDDGYADNLHVARPLLERFDVPCTFFLASGHIGCGEQFWWDQLARALLETRCIPPTLRLTVGGRHHRWELGASAESSDNDVIRDRRWLAWGQADRGPRHTAFRELYELLQPMPTATRRDVVGRLLAWAGIDVAGPVEDWPLSRSEAISLVSSDLFDIGAHTVSHPLLGAMPPDAQRDEIRGGKTQLEELLGRPVRLFAYPFGRACDYSEDTVSFVRDAQYEAACSNFGDLVSSDTDRFQLPRVQVHDWDGDELLRRLDGWLDD